MLIFKPTLVVNGTRFELPRPVLALRLQYSWDQARFKVPLLPGDQVVGRSMSGVDVSIEGQIGTQAGQLKASEADMFHTLEQLRNLTATPGDVEMRLILYQNQMTLQEHLLRQVSITRFEYDLSDTHLFTYSTLIHASDPMIHVEIPS
jgi:hypothetical protein